MIHFVAREAIKATALAYRHIMSCALLTFLSPTWPVTVSRNNRNSLSRNYYNHPEERGVQLSWSACYAVQLYTSVIYNRNAIELYNI